MCGGGGGGGSCVPEASIHNRQDPWLDSVVIQCDWTWLIVLETNDLEGSWLSSVWTLARNPARWLKSCSIHFLGKCNSAVVLIRLGRRPGLGLQYECPQAKRCGFSRGF